MSSLFAGYCKTLITKFIHQDFHGVVEQMKLLDAFILLIVLSVDKKDLWHRMPVFLGLLYLGLRRRLHQSYNLINVGKSANGVGGFNPADYPYRTADGKYNDPNDANAGSQNTLFGRNVMPVEQDDKIIRPHPAEVASKLLSRREYKDTGKQFNMVAASWIQFMIHDWIDHLEDTKQVYKPQTTIQDVLSIFYSNLLDLLLSQCPLSSFKFFLTKEVTTGLDDIKTGTINARTAWWDGSGIYGSDASKLEKVRIFKDGKLKLGEDGLLVVDEDGFAVSGEIRNSWSGVSAIHALFTKEHNAVCDMLKKENPEMGDEELYRRARLVTSAVIAKVHTIDWTVELLKTDTLLAAMRINWYGILGKWFKDKFGNIGDPRLGGLVGLKEPQNHGVPYSLTEEFVSVYRMHPILPDEFLIRDISSTPNKSLPVVEKLPIQNLLGSNGEKALSKIGFTKQMVSMGHQACGALELWNYPNWLRNVAPHDPNGRPRPDHVDLPALEVYRDRERNVARYNEFRRRMLMIPISKWEDLTDDKEAVRVLTEVYGDDGIEELDLLVGLMAEKKIKGFAISETAFFIFVMMASRRLEADRFFTSYFNEETYTKKGLAWVNTTESLKDVIDRNYPGMTEKWMNSTSAFTVWDAPPQPYNPIPLCLRIP
ncbi:Alpha-dioxygenase PIOX [Linum grandiflorum]